MTAFRKITWYMSGLKEYTKGGYEKASKNFDPNDLKVDLSGFSYMITGANSGVGKCAANELAKLGATIHMVCRSKQRGEEALKELIEETKSDKFKLHLLDMSNPNDVYKFAKNFESSGETLDVLINNAGCMINELKKNADNVEMNFATNVVSTFVLTEALINTLQKSKEPRVITVSSGGMLVEKLDISDLNWDTRAASKFDGTMVYAQNKRQQVILTEQWASKYPQIKFYSMHPGWADTPAVQSSMPSFYEKHKTKLRTPLQGADTIIWLAASKSALNQPSGEFYQDRRVTSKHLTLACTRESTTDATKLYEILHEYLEKYSQ